MLYMANATTERCTRRLYGNWVRMAEPVRVTPRSCVKRVQLLSTNCKKWTIISIKNR